jgi:hypothetical protein
MKKVLSNLPVADSADSADFAKTYFNYYADAGNEFNANDVEATIGYLKSAGFGEQAAIVTSSILLKQAKQENIPVYSLLDTLKGLESLELSTIVSTVLNQNRSVTSVLGFRFATIENQFQTRNILP